MDIEIKAPEGYKLVESIKDGIKHISFVPEEKEIILKTAMDCWGAVVENFMRKKVGFFYDTEENKIESIKLNFPRPSHVLDTHLTKERAQAFLYLQALVTARDYYNDGWVADWSNEEDKFCILFFEGKIGKDYFQAFPSILNFKTSEIRDKFYEDFKEWIELCKDLI